MHSGNSTTQWTGSGGFSIKSGGVFYQYSILMYPAVFRCILLKYCILAYSDVFQNVFSYLTSYLDEGELGGGRGEQPAHCYYPAFSSPAELLEAWCRKALLSWLLELEDDLGGIADRPPEARSERPQPFVAGQDCFVEQARGCVWDLRRAGEGIIAPLDFGARIHSRLVEA